MKKEPWFNNVLDTRFYPISCINDFTTYY